jgi:hypothetical protein
MFIGWYFERTPRMSCSNRSRPPGSQPSASVPRYSGRIQYGSGGSVGNWIWRL